MLYHYILLLQALFVVCVTSLEESVMKERLEQFILNRVNEPIMNPLPVPSVNAPSLNRRRRDTLESESQNAKWEAYKACQDLPGAFSQGSKKMKCMRTFWKKFGLPNSKRTKLRRQDETTPEPDTESISLQAIPQPKGPSYPCSTRYARTDYFQYFQFKGAQPIHGTIQDTKFLVPPQWPRNLTLYFHYCKVSSATKSGFELQQERLKSRANNTIAHHDAQKSLHIQELKPGDFIWEKSGGNSEDTLDDNGGEGDHRWRFANLISLKSQPLELQNIAIAVPKTLEKLNFVPGKSPKRRKRIDTTLTDSQTLPAPPWTSVKPWLTILNEKKKIRASRSKSTNDCSHFAGKRDKDGNMAPLKCCRKAFDLDFSNNDKILKPKKLTIHRCIGECDYPLHDSTNLRSLRSVFEDYFLKGQRISPGELCCLPKDYNVVELYVKGDVATESRLESFYQLDAKTCHCLY